MTYNPWITSHWTKDFFWDRTQPNTDRFTTTHKCNEFLDEADHERIERLIVTDPERYRVVGLGEYGVPGGTYFSEFRESIHVVDTFEPPKDWNRYTATDYGLDMEATVWVAIDYQGTAWVYKESYKPNLIISDAAAEILRVNNGDFIRLRYGPPDLMARNKTSGKTTWELFAQYGWSLWQTDNRRKEGALAMKEWLKPIKTIDTEGNPIVTAKLQIMRNCKNLIRTLPNLSKDELDENKYATTPHELTHAPDALRYFCIMHQRPPTKALGKTLRERFLGIPARSTLTSLAGDFY